MKDKLIHDIELKLAISCPGTDRERILQCVISCLNDYDVTARETGITVRYEDTNERILKRYVACIRIDGKSEKTIYQYVTCCSKLGAFLQKPYTEMSAYDIRYFLAEQKAKGIQNRTVENYRSYISAFFHWMAVEEIIQKDPCEKIKPIKVEDKQRLPFTSVEIDLMRSACKTLKRRAILEVLLSSGVRCEELVRLDVNDVDIKNRALTVRRGKGGKSRKTYISEVAAEHLEKYLNSRKDDHPELFQNRSGERYETTCAIRKLVNAIAADAGVKKAHPHKFRRTFATTLYKRGMDIHEIQRLMGHSNVQTTLEYIYTEDSQIRSAYEKYAA